MHLKGSVMLEIDGAHGEGGGQLVRAAVALAAVTGRPVRISNIRAGRSKPGLAAQHVAAVRAVAELCGGSVENLALKSSQIKFRPGRRSGGAFRFEIGTAGSISLVLQALIPVAVSGAAPCRVTIGGGTDVRGAPSIDYLQHVLLPLIGRMGARVSLHVRRRGYYPRGGGEVELSVAPSKLRPVRLEVPGRLLRIGGLAHVAGLPLSVAERMRDAAARQLATRTARLEVETVEMEEGQAIGQGGAIVLWAEMENASLGVGRTAERGVRAEMLGEAAGHEFADDLAAGAALDVHAADQMLVYLALAGGESSFTTRALTSHACTAMWLIEQFLPVRFAISAVGACTRVSVRG